MYELLLIKFVKNIKLKLVPKPLRTLPESGEILNIIIKQFYPKNPSLFCDITSNSQFESLFDFTEKIANRK